MIFTPSSLSWLKKHKISSNLWTELPQEEVARQSSDFVGVAAFCSPGSRLGPSEVAAMRSIQYLAAIDMNYLEAGTVTAQEQIGMILHELGHVFNPAPCDATDCMNQSLKEELFADHYVFICGYASSFASALSKLRDAHVYGFATSDIQYRIDQLTSPGSERINLKTFINT